VIWPIYSLKIDNVIVKFKQPHMTLFLRRHKDYVTENMSLK